MQYEGADSAGMISDELSMMTESQPYSLSQPLATNSQPYGFQHSAELSIPLKQNLRNLKNVLKLPKARR